VVAQNLGWHLGCPTFAAAILVDGIYSLLDRCAGLLLSFLGLLSTVIVGITIVIFPGVDTLAICGFMAVVLLVVWTLPPFLLVVCLWLVPWTSRIGICLCPHSCPFCSSLALIALALVVIVGLPLLLELFDGGLQGHDFLKFWGRGFQV